MNIIETRNLTRKFGDLTAVDNLNITVKKGEVLGLLGPNGAGKTTSIRMMVGLLKPTAGEVIIKGEHVDARSEVIKSTVGVVPQEVVIWKKLTCFENLILIADMYEVPRHVSIPRADKFLTDLQLMDKKDVLAEKLSGGMKRRLNLALALMHDPEIVVLDEPSPGLDPQTRLLLWDFISEIPKKGDKTVILTTHFMDEADKLCSRVAIVDQGNLLVLDTPENLKKSLGEGDGLQLTADADIPATCLKAAGELKGVIDATVIGPRLTIRALNAISHVPRIYEILEEAGLNINDISLKANTLEDVFIHLTGRSLRSEGDTGKVENDGEKGGGEQ